MAPMEAMEIITEARSLKGSDEESNASHGSKEELAVILRGGPSRQVSLLSLRSNSASTLHGRIRPDLSSYPVVPCRSPIYTTLQNRLEQKRLGEELGIRSQDNIWKQDSMTTLVAPSLVHIHNSSRQG